MPIFKYDKQPLLFTRRRRRQWVIFTLIACVILIFYQVLIHYVLSNQKPKSSPEPEPARIRGSHVQEAVFYAPVKGKFTCIKSGEIIPFQKVNDDYCDCADSSDEPGTNACPDGLFHCGRVATNTKYPKMVPSSKVNDGICDCCDGSEEYKVQHLLGQVPQSNDPVAVCPNKC